LNEKILIQALALFKLSIFRYKQNQYHRLKSSDRIRQRSSRRTFSGTYTNEKTPSASGWGFWKTKPITTHYLFMIRI